MNTKIGKGIAQAISLFLTAMLAGSSLLVAGLTAILNAAGYGISNFLWVSASPQGELGLKDLAKGLLMAAIGGLSAYLASLLPGAVFSWPLFWTAATTAIGVYLSQTFTEGQKK